MKGADGEAGAGDAVVRVVTTVMEGSHQQQGDISGALADLKETFTG